MTINYKDLSHFKGSPLKSFICGNYTFSAAWFEHDDEKQKLPEGFKKYEFFAIDKSHKYRFNQIYTLSESESLKDKEEEFKTLVKRRIDI